jgi:hypothetical protein
MIQRAHCPGFARETVYDGLVARKLFGQQLECDFAFKLGISRQPDFSHSACAQQ